MYRCNVVVEHTDDVSDLHFGCINLTVLEGSVLFREKDDNDNYHLKYVTLHDDTVRHIVIDLYNDEVDK